ncbi:helix-turn-helix domain-containing protein [Embleya sp. AB8]|uniref:helix-turn-helix domain-containing protein n=1 Tax=Embleya sp. AB8 TaxID=3156304 RepID=UPI003C738A78
MPELIKINHPRGRFVGWHDESAIGTKRGSMGTTPGYARRRLGAKLKDGRKRLGWTLDQVAAEFGWDGSKVSRIENAKSPISRHDMVKLGTLYGFSTADLDSMEGWRENGRDVQWWASYRDILTGSYEELISLENEAARIVTATSCWIPGLLQVPAYARAVIAASPFVTDPDDASALVEIRTRRQKLLTDTSPVEYTALLGEALLHARIGSLDVHREQLAHLLQVSNLPNVEVLIAPFTAPFLIGGECSILEFATPDDPSVVYVEYQDGATFRETHRDLARFDRKLSRTRETCVTAEASRALIQARLDALT